METAYQFVPMVAADLPQLAEYATEAFNVDELNEAKWTTKTSLQHLKEGFNPEYSWSIKLNNLVVGGVTAFPVTFQGGPELLINILVIAKPHRCQGLGTKFLKFLEEKATEKGLVGFFLLSNPKLPSYRWYHHLGFKATSWVELAKNFTSQS